MDEKKIYVLMGANGSGKTTLFNLLTGFIRLQNGKFIFREKDITNFPPYLINRNGISRTFQDLRTITKLTVKENIILSMHDNPSDAWYNAMLSQKFFRKKHDEFDQRADEIIRTFFLEDVRTSLASDISYGQQKLLTLACCMANGAKLLLLDEPVAGINPEYRDRIAQLLRKIKDQGKTILLIEHNTEFIDQVADHLYFLDEGCLKNYESIDQMRSDPAVMEAFL